MEQIVANFDIRVTIRKFLIRLSNENDDLPNLFHNIQSIEIRNLLKEILEWLLEIKKINIENIQVEDRQKIVDQFLNTEIGKKAFSIVDIGSFYSCWPKI